MPGVGGVGLPSPTKGVDLQTAFTEGAMEGIKGGIGTAIGGLFESVLFGGKEKGVAPKAPIQKPATPMPDPEAIKVAQARKLALARSPRTEPRMETFLTGRGRLG